MKKNITLFLFTLLLCCNVNAQDGTNDLTFNPDDTGYGNGVNNMITSVLPLANGKVFIAGAFTAYKNESISRVGMLNADKSLDMSFVSGSGANDIVWVSVLQADGKIIIGGDFTEYDGQIRNKIARLNADGSLDTNFNIGTGAGSISTVRSIVLQADGKILVGGYFDNFNNQAASNLVRLNVDGSLDTSFSVTGVTGDVLALAVEADGQILVGGYFSQFNGSSKKRLVRLNSDGSTDTTFAVADGPNDSVECIAVNNQGKIFVGGRFTTFNQQPKRGIIGLNEDGSVNTSFNVGTGLLFGWVRTIVIKEDGKVIMGGDLSSYKGSETGAAIQINTDGSLDAEFQLGSAEFGAYSIKIGQEGKIFIAGRFKTYGGLVENHITCRNSNGSRNTLFDNGPGTGADNGIRSTVVQPDGKIIIGGSFNYYNGVLKSRIARLNVDGSNDNTFLTGLGFNSDVLLVLLQPDGKIIVSGYFTKYKGLPVDPVVRLNVDGSLDTSFNFNLPFEMENVYISRAVIQPDGKIILGEQFMDLGSGITFKNICRLKATGAFDSNFNSQALARNVNEVLLQPDGKIIVAYGAYYLDDNIFMQRLNSDGSIDTSFSVSAVSTLNLCFNMVLQSDGKIVLSGGVYTDGVFTNKVLRINADGTLDSSFSEIVLGEKKIYKLWLQPDDKMLATGDFETFDGFPTKGFVRINQNGSVDTTFNCGEGANNGINSVSFQGSKIIISGLFTAYDNIGRNGISRINSTGFLDNDTFIELNNNIIVYKTNNSIVINSIKDIASVEVYDLMGRLIAQKRNIKDINTSLDEILASNTVLIVKVKHVDGTRVTKKIYY